LSKGDAKIAVKQTIELAPNWVQPVAIGLSMRGNFSRERRQKRMPQLEPELLSRILPSYIKAREEDARKLHLALEASDFHILERLGHKIRGSALTYGFVKTAALAEQLERAARAQDLEICAAFVENMETLFFKA
jgi:HPt (histidine-containing phosphotransfer) domain-containing protein